MKSISIRFLSCTSSVVFTEISFRSGVVSSLIAYYSSPRYTLILIATFSSAIGVSFAFFLVKTALATEFRSVTVGS